MKLTRLQLAQFKNYQTAELVPDAPFVAFTGLNGAGKTNLLDAVYYLALTKSYFNAADKQTPLHGTDFFTLKGTFTFPDRSEDRILCAYDGTAKTLKRNDIPYERLADHIGRIPVVINTPDDVSLIIGGSEERRRFIDGTLSQTNRDYLHNLMAYNRILRQKNSYLKSIAEQFRTPDHNLLDTYDEQLAGHGTPVHEIRQIAATELSDRFLKHYARIAADREQVELIYRSPLNEDDFAVILNRNRSRDIDLRRTAQGPHKDDFAFKINGYPVKKFGSQGQQKSFLLALKLAQFDLIRERLGRTPLLLLDDLFDRLDRNRIRQLLDRITELEPAQVFITDTAPDRSRTLLADTVTLGNFRLYEIEDGRILNPDA